LRKLYYFFFYFLLPLALMMINAMERNRDVAGLWTDRVNYSMKYRYDRQ
jgi:hypothetical protein